MSIFESAKQVEIHIPEHTLSELDDIAIRVGHSIVNANVRLIRGDNLGAEAWLDEARVFSKRAQGMTRVYPQEIRQGYRRRVNDIIDGYK